MIDLFSIAQDLCEKNWPSVDYKQIKIILHRIISVVWLTNFLSEIRNLTNPRWWVEQQFLSVKRCWNFSWRSNTLMIAHLSFKERWKELVLSEWFSQLEFTSSKVSIYLTFWHLIIKARGFTPLISLANFQILDDMFNNIIGSGIRILEEVLCDPAKIGWMEFEASVVPNIRKI